MNQLSTDKLYICPHCGAVEDVWVNDGNNSRLIKWTTTKCHSCGKPYKRVDAKTTTSAAEIERKLQLKM